MHMDGGLWSEVKIVEAQSNQLRYTKSGSEGQMQHGAVPDACWACRIGRVE